MNMSTKSEIIFVCLCDLWQPGKKNMKTETYLLSAGIFLATLMSALGQPDIATDPQAPTNVGSSGKCVPNS